MTGLAVVPTSPAPQSLQMNALVPRNIQEAISLANTLSSASLVPEHLRNHPGDCLLVVMQAQRWGMDVLSVAQCTSVVRGKLCYEGKLVAAALYSMGAVDGRLRYDFSGSGEGRAIRITGRPRGMAEEQTVEGTVADWKTENGNWKKSPDDMLVYRGTRQWARRYAPEALLGVYTPDEMEDAPEPMRTVSPASAPAARAIYSDHDFEANFPTWNRLIASGKNTPAEVIAKLETKAALTEHQRKLINDLKPAQAEGGAA